MEIEYDDRLICGYCGLLIYRVVDAVMPTGWRWWHYSARSNREHRATPSDWGMPEPPRSWIDNPEPYLRQGKSRPAG